MNGSASAAGRTSRAQGIGEGVTASMYDQVILREDMRALHGGHFFNLGYWAGIEHHTREEMPRASHALVDLHIAADRDRAAGNRAMRVLDVGCGLGGATALLAAHYAPGTVIGANFSERQVQLARAAHPHLDFEVMNATALGFPDASFDTIHAVEAAFHFEPRVQFLAEARRLLRPGGRLVMTDLLYRPGMAGLPACNGCSSIEDYRAQLQAGGLMVRSLQDIREHTIPPYQQLLREIGELRAARALGKVHSYVVVSAEKQA